MVQRLCTHGRNHARFEAWLRHIGNAQPRLNTGRAVARQQDLRQGISKTRELLDVLVTPEAVSSDAKSGLAWVPDLQALSAWDEAERNWRQSDSGNS